MLTLRRSVVGVVAVLLVSGVAWAQTPADIAELRVQANAGNASSQWLLGYYYINGEGVPQDDAQAAAWFRKAADQGLAAAQFNLGNMYAAGRGVPQDDVETHKWTNVAASRSTGDDQKQYAAVRDVIAKQMTSAQVAEAQQLVMEWRAAFGARQE